MLVIFHTLNNFNDYNFLMRTIYEENHGWLQRSQNQAPQT